VTLSKTSHPRTVGFALLAVLGGFPGSGAVYSAHDPKCALPFGVHPWGTFID
jgi:hypothetical protein